jgi:hypothetical protein
MVRFTLHRQANRKATDTSRREALFASTDCVKLRPDFHGFIQQETAAIKVWSA